MTRAFASPGACGAYRTYTASLTTRLAAAAGGFAIAFSLAAPDARAQQMEPPPGYPGSGAAEGTVTPTNNPAISPSEEAKDSGLGLEWVYLNGDVGAGFANMASFNESTLGMRQTAANGPAFGFGAGVRLLFFSVGVRVHDLQLSGIGDLWELNGEAAFHVRSSHTDFYFGVRGGYNFVGQLSSSTASVAQGVTPPSVSIHGFNVGPVLGFDYYFVHYVSIGIDLDTQFLFLQRPQIALPGGATVQQYCETDPQCAQLYNESGNSAGIAFVPTAHLGVHF